MYPGTATQKQIIPKDSRALYFKADQDDKNIQTILLAPAANISATTDEYLIVIGVPGLYREDFSIEVKEGVIRISAQHTATACGSNDRREYDYTEWTRNFALPPDADTMLANAKYKNGELILHIPRGNTIEGRDTITIYVY